MRQADEMRRVRAQRRTLFSAVHFTRFFQLALQHTIRSIVDPLDLVLASRENMTTLDEHEDHLTRFFKLGVREKVSYHLLTSYVASSVLMDAYPPRMHRRSSRIW